MQRRVVIDHRRQDERHKIHKDGADRRCHQRAPIRNAPRPIEDDHRRQYEINLGKSGLEKLHSQIRVIHYVLHQAPLENDTTTPVAGAHSNARFRGFRKNFLLRARSASAGPRLSVRASRKAGHRKSCGAKAATFPQRRNNDGIAASAKSLRRRSAICDRTPSGSCVNCRMAQSRNPCQCAWALPPAPFSTLVFTKKSAAMATT